MAYDSRQNSSALNPALIVLAAGLLLLWILRMSGIQVVEAIGSGFSRPLLAVSAFAEEGIHSFWRGFAENRNRAEELEKRIVQLELELAAAQKTLQVRSDLGAVLQQPAPTGWTWVTAPVLLRDPAKFDRRFRIGAGTAAGLAPGNAVLVDGMVVGRILQCGQYTSMAVSLLDPQCKLSVRVADSQNIGILGGESLRQNLVAVTYLPRDAVFPVGRPLLTSGLGTEVPGGLRIGDMALVGHGRTIELMEGMYGRGCLRPAISHYGFTRVVVVVHRSASPAAATKEKAAGP
jgi:cell shape-determining protein MreC